jgi:hypothetical protein
VRAQANTRCAAAFQLVQSRYRGGESRNSASPGETNYFHEPGKVGILVSAHAVARGDLSDRRDAVQYALAHTGFDCTAGITTSTSTLGNHQANPIGQRHAGRSERLWQSAEFQVRVRVDQTGQQRDCAQILYISAIVDRVSANCHNPLAIERNRPVLNRRPTDRKNKSCSQSR